jgi:hypothetical protein
MRKVVTSPTTAFARTPVLTESYVAAPACGRMPIRSHLNGQRFDAETIRVMGLAYELTLISLRLVDRGDIANDVVAQKIIELVKTGERDPEHLCKVVVQQWGRPIAYVAPSDQIWSSVWAILTRQICGPKISSFNGGSGQTAATSQARSAIGGGTLWPIFDSGFEDTCRDTLGASGEFGTAEEDWSLTFVLWEAHDEARTVPKLYSRAVGRLSSFADGFLVVGALNYVGGSGIVTVAVHVIDAILWHDPAPVLLLSLVE